MTPKTFKIDTLGCKSNQYDSQRLREVLESAGFSPAAGPEPPDIRIINTCTVTHTADRKARQLIRRAKREQPGSRVFVTGCYATARKESAGRIPGVDGVYGHDEWDTMLRDLCSPAGVESKGVPCGRFGLRRFDGRSRAYVKIQDGCNARCSYCIVPHVRGRSVSRPLADALLEGGRLIEAGFREIVLTGIHTGLYGKDLPDRLDLADAVSAFAALDQNVRIRISSLEGPEVGDRLLDAMGAPNVCAHLHLPLQSGDADVLRTMRRGYGPEEFSRVLDSVRTALDEPAISTDVIVGFPGETDRAFCNTLEFCEEAQFSRIHVFLFSPRPHTDAQNMRPRVDPAAARQRSRVLRLLDERLRIGWAAGFIGHSLRVLYEKMGPDGWMHGYSDRYVRVKAPAGGEIPGELRITRGVGIEKDVLVGELKG